MNRSPDKANPFKRRGAGSLARDEVSSSFFFFIIGLEKNFQATTRIIFYMARVAIRIFSNFPRSQIFSKGTGSVSGNERNIFTSHPDYLRIRFRYLNEEMRIGRGGRVRSR